MLKKYYSVMEIVNDIRQIDKDIKLMDFFYHDHYDEEDDEDKFCTLENLKFYKNIDGVNVYFTLPIRLSGCFIASFYKMPTNIRIRNAYECDIIDIITQFNNLVHIPVYLKELKNTEVYYDVDTLHPYINNILTENSKLYLEITEMPDNVLTDDDGTDFILTKTLSNDLIKNLAKIDNDILEFYQRVNYCSEKSCFVANNSRYEVKRLIYDGSYVVFRDGKPVLYTAEIRHLVDIFK